jgi:hypothetical protein
MRKSLDIETLNVNGGVFVRTEQDRVALLKAAEAMWVDKRGQS